MDANQKDGVKHNVKGGVFAGKVTDIKTKQTARKLKNSNGGVQHAAGNQVDEARKQRDKGNKNGEESRT